MSHRDNHRFNILGLLGLLCFFMVLTISIEAPWDEPKLELMRTGYEQDGKEGTLFRSQKFDKELMKWDKFIDEFVEDMEPVGD